VSAGDPRNLPGALCAQADPDAFFPDKGGPTRQAKRVCANCEHRVECLEYALATRERFGVWGGLSERERRPILRERDAAAEQAKRAAERPAAVVELPMPAVRPEVPAA
jgi:hypothetical protein